MYEGRESRIIWYVDESFTPCLATGYSINNKYPENPGPDEMLFIPEYGSTSNFWDTFGEAHENALQVIEKEIIDKKANLRKLEKKYSELLDPDFWKPFLN